MTDVSATIDDEAAARIHLAALYRLIDQHFPSTDGIYNHLSLRIPGRVSEFLIKRHGLLYTEVTASNLVVADLTRDLDEASDINRPGFILHSAILRARPDANCVVHLHSAAGLAMSAHAGGLKMLSQNALRFYRRIGRHPYEGITDSADEGPRIAEAFGADNIAVFLENHGLAVIGRTPRDAFERTRDLIIACTMQLTLEAACAPLIEVRPEVCQRVAAQFDAHDRGRGGADWPAWLRQLDPAFRT